MARNQHLNSFDEAFVVKVHVAFYSLHLFHDIFGQELWERGKLLTCSFIQDNNQAACLLQVLDLGANKVFIAFNAHNRNSIVAHICNNFANKLPQLIMATTFTTIGLTWASTDSTAPAAMATSTTFLAW